MIHIKKSLKLIPSSQIILHEKDEPNRLEKVMFSIEQEKLLRNPILVIKSNIDDKYLVIDGVHRFSSLLRMGFSQIPCQVVEETQFELHSWSHLIKKGSWLNELNHEHIEFTKSERIGNRYIAKLMSHNQPDTFVYLKSHNKNDLGLFVNMCNHIVSSYIDRERIIRIDQVNPKINDEDYIMIVFPKFSLHDISWLCSNGYLLPTGITRFLIRGRILNLQIPLSVLDDHHSNHVWDHLLEKWNDHLRYYSEPVYLYE